MALEPRKVTLNFNHGDTWTAGHFILYPLYWPLSAKRFLKHGCTDIYRSVFSPYLRRTPGSWPGCVHITKGLHQSSTVATLAFNNVHHKNTESYKMSVSLYPCWKLHCHNQGTRKRRHAKSNWFLGFTCQHFLFCVFKLWSFLQVGWVGTRGGFSMLTGQ